MSYFTWDSERGEIEVFDHNRNHLGAMDPLTGRMRPGSKEHNPLPKWVGENDVDETSPSSRTV